MGNLVVGSLSVHQVIHSPIPCPERSEGIPVLSDHLPTDSVLNRYTVRVLGKRRFSSKGVLAWFRRISCAIE